MDGPSALYWFLFQGEPGGGGGGWKRTSLMDWGRRGGGFKGLGCHRMMTGEWGSPHPGDGFSIWVGV